jgi:hypothetical protein
MKLRLQRMMDVVLVAIAIMAAGIMGLGMNRAQGTVTHFSCATHGGVCIFFQECYVFPDHPDSEKCSGGTDDQFCCWN